MKTPKPMQRKARWENIAYRALTALLFIGLNVGGFYYVTEVANRCGEYVGAHR